MPIGIPAVERQYCRFDPFFCRNSGRFRGSRRRCKNSDQDFLHLLFCVSGFGRRPAEKSAGKTQKHLTVGLFWCILVFVWLYANIFFTEDRPGKENRSMHNELLKVAKFGGSSLSDPRRFGEAISIIKAQEERRFVVVSAPGKRFSGDEKVTDQIGRASCRERV